MTTADTRLPFDGVTLTVDVSYLDDHVIVQVRGELDISNAHDLRQAVATIELGGRQRVELDLSDLTFCDAGGITALLRVQRAVERAGGRLLVRGLSGEPRAVLAVTHVDDVLGLD